MIRYIQLYVLETTIKLYQILEPREFFFFFFGGGGGGGGGGLYHIAFVYLQVCEMF